MCVASVVVVCDCVRVRVCDCDSAQLRRKRMEGEKKVENFCERGPSLLFKCKI